MVTWKKVIVSGSTANLAALQVSNLPSGQVVIGGGGSTMTTTAINGSGDIVATTGATSMSASGSFSGSFYGSFSGGISGSATSASYATTASYAVNASTASNIGPAILNNTNNYVLTATGNGTINGEANLTFDGSTLILTGSQNMTGNLQINGGSISTTASTLNVGNTAGTTTVNVGYTGNTVNMPTVIVSGDLTVNGTTTFINTQNLYIKDRFVEIASGSTTLVDAGIIAQYNVAGSGSAMYLSSTPGNYGRFAVAYDVVGTSTTVAPDEYVVTAKINQASTPVAAPTWGSSGYGTGNMWITSAGDIYIYA
jgi:hypothetical protein